MQSANESWYEKVINRLRSMADEGLDLLSFDMTRVLLSLLLGLIGGLALGLFLGWVVWPVQWTNTRPSHLEPDAKSQYIASVADAYVATRGDANALETARMRLIGIADDDFGIAQMYFASPGSISAGSSEFDGLSVYEWYAQREGISFDNNIRLNNINQLAAGLGVVGNPALSTNVNPNETSAGESDQTQAPDTPQSADSPATNASTDGSTNNAVSDTSTGATTPTTGFFNGGLGSAIACLTALMLVFGGVYILVLLNQRMDWIKRPLMGGQRGARAAFDDGDNWDDGAFDDDAFDNDVFDESLRSPQRENARRGEISPVDAYRGRAQDGSADGGATRNEGPRRNDNWIDPNRGQQPLDTDEPRWAEQSRWADGFSGDPGAVGVDTEFESDSFDDDDGYDDSRGRTDRYTDVGPAALSTEPPMAAASPQPQRKEPPTVPSYDRPLREQAMAQSQREQDWDRPDFDSSNAAYPTASALGSGGLSTGIDAEDSMRDPSYDPALDYREPPGIDDHSWSASSSALAASAFAEPSAVGQPLQAASNSLDGSRSRAARTRRTVLDFTTSFKRGASLQYEEKQQIFVDGDGLENYGRNVGEYGIGINLKNGILLNNPHDVLALDVWLLDKLDIEKVTTINRVLISEYVVEQELEKIIQRENPSNTPLVPQPGLEFELQGPNLSATCRVLEASYIQDGELTGIFNSLVVQVTIYAPA